MTARRWARGLLLPVALVLVWWLAVRYRVVNARIVASPAAVLAEARRLLAAGDFWSNLGASLGRDLLGLVVGALAGVMVGATLGLSRTFHRLFAPTLNAFKQVAIFAWIPLISFWFGYGEPAKVVSIALAAFYPVALNTCDGVYDADSAHVEVARVLGFSRWQLWRLVVLPSALPAILSGLRLALITAWIATIGAEYFLAVGPGIGRLMIEGREQLRMDRVLLGVAITGLVGFVMAALAARAEAHLLRWRRGAL